MHFNRQVWRALGGALSFTLALSACQFHIGDAKPSSAEIELGQGDSACLSAAGETLSKFLDGRLRNGSSDELARAWDCASRALRLFSESTQGAKPDEYSPEELRRFLQKYYLKDFKISDRLLSEAMRLKRAWLGGSDQSITRKEIDLGGELFNIFKTQSLALQPYMPLTPDHAATLSDEELDCSRSILLRAAESLGTFLDAHGQEYWIPGLDTLTGEYVRARPGSRLAKIRERMALIYGLKAALISPDSQRIAKGEWTLALTTSARWYSIGLGLRQLKSRYPHWESGAARERFFRFTSNILDLLDESIRRHPGQVIPFDVLDHVVDALRPDELRVGDRQFHINTIKNLLRPVIRRVLGGFESNDSGRLATGLTSAAVDRARNSFKHWVSGQRYLESVYQRLGEDVGNQATGNLGFVPEDLLSLNLQDLTGLIGLGSGKEPPNPFLEQAVSEIQTIVRTERPFFTGDDLQISFPGYVYDRRISYHNLSEVFWMQELARLLPSAYSENRKRAETSVGVTQSEFTTFYKDVRQFGIELKFFDPVAERVPEKRFREANLFTFAGNGDEYVSVAEARELLAFLLSAKTLSNRIHQDIQRKCPTGALDIFGYPVIESRCYRNRMFGWFERYWDRMPGMAAYYRALPEKRRAEFQYRLEVAARATTNLALPMDSNDSDGFAMVLQYVESMFDRFDEDQSGTIGPSEAARAFPIFARALSEVTQVKDPAILEAVFYYLLTYGKPPKETWSGKLYVWYLSWRKGHLSFEADRGRILEIFGALSSAPARP